MASEETVRCFKCGQMAPVSRVLRRECRVGGTSGMILGNPDGLRSYHGSQTAVVDICDECAAQMDHQAEVNSTGFANALWFVILAVVVFGGIAFAVGLFLASKM